MTFFFYAARYRACATRNSRVIARFLPLDCRGITTPCGFAAVPLTRALIWMTHRILAALAATEWATADSRRSMSNCTMSRGAAAESFAPAVATLFRR